jgi:hypothetical protein
MLIVDMSEVKLPGEAKQNNLLLECGQPIDGGGNAQSDTGSIELSLFTLTCYRLPHPQDAS